MLIGEAPGATEDEMGRPFVGAAGKLLTFALESVGIPRPSVYITNVVKCRPPGNREPNEEEIRACEPYLEWQIRAIRPKIIVTLGNVAGKWIFEHAGLKWSGVTRMRGRVYRLKLFDLEVLVLPTLHPAAALYNPPKKSIFLDDIKKLKEILDKISRGEEVEATSVSISTQEKTSRPRSLLDYIKR